MSRMCSSSSAWMSLRQLSRSAQHLHEHKNHLNVARDLAAGYLVISRACCNCLSSTGVATCQEIPDD